MLQAFIPPQQDFNNMIEVKIESDKIKIQRVQNRISLKDESKTLVDRLVTVEASQQNPNVVRQILGSEGPI